MYIRPDTGDTATAFTANDGPGPCSPEGLVTLSSGSPMVRMGFPEEDQISVSARRSCQSRSICPSRLSRARLTSSSWRGYEQFDRGLAVQYLRLRTFGRHDIVTARTESDAPDLGVRAICLINVPDRTSNSATNPSLVPTAMRSPSGLNSNANSGADGYRARPPHRPSVRKPCFGDRSGPALCSCSGE